MHQELLTSNPLYRSSQPHAQTTTTSQPTSIEAEPSTTNNIAYDDIIIVPSTESHQITEDSDTTQVPTPDNAAQHEASVQGEVTSGIHQTGGANTDPEKEYNVLIHTGNQYTQVQVDRGYSKLRGGAKPNPERNYNILVHNAGQHKRFSFDSPHTQDGYSKLEGRETPDLDKQYDVLAHETDQQCLPLSS